MKYIQPTLLIPLLVILPLLGQAKVSVSINGYSIDDVLSAYKGPSGIDSKITVSQSGGSISSAKARAVFHKHTVNIGNQVISAGTAGDDEATHVRAGSLFFGKARFVAAKPGAKVKNFKILYHLDGSLDCSTSDPDVPEGYALASVETEVNFNNINRFSGAATVDGASGYDGGSGDLAGKFSGSGNAVSIDRNVKVNLGTVRDGKSYPMLFFGATLVSYGADVPIDTCAADFLDTAEFSVAEDIVDSTGQFVITPAKPVTVSYSPNPWPLNTYPDLTIYIESSDEDLLNSIDVNTVQLYERLGDNGSIAAQSLEDVGDYDSDGIPDRGVVFAGFDLYQQVLLVLLGYTDSATMFLIGETDAGTPFMGKASLDITN